MSHLAFTQNSDLARIWHTPNIEINQSGDDKDKHLVGLTGFEAELIAVPFLQAD